MTEEGEKKGENKKRGILYFWIPFIVTSLQKLLNITFRKHWIGKERFEQIARGHESFILSIWHTNVLYSPLFNRNRGIHVMISDSKDGEFIARTVARFGNKTIRGSSSHGGKRALKEAIKVLRRGDPLAITPDGPNGPPFKLKDGVIALASLTQSPIIPFHYEADRQWLLRSWDKHRIPKPFANIVLSYGAPIYLPKDILPSEYHLHKERVERAMIANMYACQRKNSNLGVKKP